MLKFIHFVVFIKIVPFFSNLKLKITLFRPTFVILLRSAKKQTRGLIPFIWICEKKYN